MTLRPLAALVALGMLTLHGETNPLTFVACLTELSPLPVHGCAARYEAALRAPAHREGYAT